MKVALYMTPILSHGAGAEKYFINLARGLVDTDLRVNVSIFTMNSKWYKMLVILLCFFYIRFEDLIKIIKGISLERENKQLIRGALSRAKWIETTPLKLSKQLKECDVIYTKNELLDLVILKLIGYKNLPPIIVGVHTPIIYPETKSFFAKLHNYLYQGFVYRWLLTGVKCVHLSNQFTKTLVDSNYKVATRLIYYPFSICNPVKINSVNQTKLRFSADKKNIVFIARLSEQKGIVNLANIIEMLADEKINNKISINIFGSGDKTNENIVEGLQQKHNFVKWYGYIENKFIPSILNKQDLFISTSQWETLPFNILEAQGVGLPAIAYNIPGPSDIITDGVTGFLVDSDIDFKDKIIKFVQNNKIFDQAVIRKSLDNKFSPRIIYRQLRDMFYEYSIKHNE